MIVSSSLMGVKSLLLPWGSASTFMFGFFIIFPVYEHLLLYHKNVHVVSGKIEDPSQVLRRQQKHGKPLQLQTSSNCLYQRNIGLHLFFEVAI